jgi:hypothetical protein
MHDLITQNGITILLPMKSLMEHIFTRPKISINKPIDEANLKIHNGNFYALDRFGLIYRKRDKNKNSVSAFKMMNGEPINVKVNELSTNFRKPEEIRKETFELIKEVLTPRMTLTKLYKEIYPELFGGDCKDGI